MQNIEQKVIDTYRSNLQYLENNNKIIFDKVILLDTLISEEKYKEKYTLEYKDEKYFDIQELATGEFLYNENSLVHAKAMVDNVDLKRTGGIFKAQRVNNLSNEQAKEIDSSELSFHNALWATATLTNYVEFYATSQTHMKRVYKIIFIDVGLGLHLQGVIDKLQPQVIFIKEKNLEIFRLSMFVTDYKSICEDHSVFFSITDNEEEERQNFIKFLDMGNNYNLNLKHIPFFKNYSSSLQRLQSHVFMQGYINYGYSAELFRFINSLDYLIDNYSFLNVSMIHKGSFLADMPVLLLLSGPSTIKNINWIIKNRHRFIVIAALSTCRLLNNYNISPDIVVHIDPGEATTHLFNDINVQDYFKNTTIILASNVNKDTINRFEKSRTFLIEQGTRYKKGFGRLSAPSVGEYSYALSLILGATNIFMLGMDLALDSKTLETHSSFHMSNVKGNLDTESTSLDPKTSVEYVKGNLADKVPSTSGFKISINQFEIFTKSLKKFNQNIYNLSDGAYLEGSVPLDINSFDWDKLNTLEDTQIQTNLNIFLNKIGEAEFNNEDKKQLKHQIKAAKNLEKKIKLHKKKKYINAEAYLNTLSKLTWELSDMDYKSGSNLAEVYYQYFPIAFSYIYDLFNTLEIDNPKKHIKSIDDILVNQLLKMSNLYISKLEKYLK